MKMTGAQILLECLEREGVDILFGYPGAATIDVYHRFPQHSIKHILVRHEQAAVHAADGYARASGKVGVCIVTSGPGATNTVTGIATANSDSVPLVVITGQVPNKLIGNDAFQEVDITGITRPCTKHNFVVPHISELASIIRKAFFLARAGRPGPVLVDLPKDVVLDSTEFVWPEEVHLRGYNPTYKVNAHQLQRAIEAISAAERPLFLIGGGVISANATEEVFQLAKLLDIPVVGTLMALGGYPASDNSWLGMIGMHGTFAANKAISSADCIFAVGARFDDRVTGRLSAFAKGAHIIHVDIDPTTIRKNVVVHTPIVCDCKVVLKGMVELLEQNKPVVPWEEKHAEWLATVREWREQQPLAYVKSDDVIKPQEVIEIVHELTKGEAIITTEVGQNQMWAAQFYKFDNPRTFLTSGGLGTMGYGFPAAIGAQFAFPDKCVIDIAGDGSIQMNIQELATAMQYKKPVKILILNNCHLGMVRQWQELFYNQNYSHTNMEAQPDFVRLAKAYGAEGYRIEKKEDLVPTLKTALFSPNLAIIDVRICRSENVYPMVPAGAALDEMILV